MPAGLGEGVADGSARLQCSGDTSGIRSFGQRRIAVEQGPEPLDDVGWLRKRRGVQEREARARLLERVGARLQQRAGDADVPLGCTPVQGTCQQPSPLLGVR